ncbi:MAG: hypothetical protein QXD77_02715 [Candidatus Aenigmatarchaeota archaeon]
MARKKLRAKKEPVVTELHPVANSHGEKPVKCAFCERPAVTVVRGYPVCEEHAEELYREAERGPAAAEPHMKDHAPPMGTAKVRPERKE